ncbi:hypothetical protein HJC23_004884 [Cyclotella cryptica]|uniref:RWD domain-containing protein n=1 Tax=Cyclotella cryptica TaxID=29204 RepID=A0ABD3P3S6_9STRA|eukprot:CCRYP_017544-RA/>CCRYP_017544-RA protein AED:0.05 eAED:0.05 QI:101/-1/1/1/-1/1/1/60/493
MSTETLPSSIPSEVSEAQAMFPSIKVLTSTPHFLIATYERTPYTRIKMTLTFPEGYPSHPLIVNIDQDAIVPPGLKKKLEKELGELVRERAMHGQYDQVRVVWERLTSFVDTNMFLPCWKELKKCVDLVRTSNNDTSSNDRKTNMKASTIALVESKGKIKINLHNEAYFYNCTIVIDPAYPDYSPATGGKSCLLQLQSTNFPSTIQTLLTSQAQEIVRRMQEGLSQERAMFMSNPIRLPKNFHLNKEDDTSGTSRALTQETIKNIKHDTETLKRVNELRKKESAAAKITMSNGNGGYQDHKAMAKERKDARRNIHKLTEVEREADQKLQEKEKEWKLEEKKRSEGYYDLYNTMEPQPCLYVLVKFLVDKVRGLVEEVCPCCKERVLPDDPNELISMYGPTDKNGSDHPQQKQHHPKSTKKKMKPMRTYCGCWYHKSCLNTLLTEPPFGIECPTVDCGRRVFHPDWPGDIRQLERDWAAREARKREVEDAMLFL